MTLKVLLVSSANNWKGEGPFTKWFENSTCLSVAAQVLVGVVMNYSYLYHSIAKRTTYIKDLKAANTFLRYLEKLERNCLDVLCHNIKNIFSLKVIAFKSIKNKNKQCLRGKVFITHTRKDDNPQNIKSKYCFSHILMKNNFGSTLVSKTISK